MEIILSLLTGLIFAAAVFLMLHKGMVRLVLGIMLLGYATNLFIFLIARITRGLPAIIADNSEVMSGQFADPVPQALILTAIVIGFGMQAFAIVLIRRVYKATGTANMDELNNTDKLEP